MSDNPNDSPLLHLGVDVDTASFNPLNAAIDALNARIDDLIETISRIALTGDESAAQFLQQLQNIDRASVDSGQNINALSQEVDRLAAEYGRVAQAAAGANEAIGAAGRLEAFRAQRFSENEGALPSVNEMASGIDDSGGGGSLFGIAHAASVAGHATGSPALRDVGAFLYVEEGIKRVIPLFESLNATISATPGVLSPVISVLTDLGIPMAGLFAVAAPVALAFGGVVLEINALNDKLKDSSVAVDAAISAIDKFYKEIGKATSSDAQKKIDDARTKQADDEAHLATLQAAYQEGRYGKGGQNTVGQINLDEALVQGFTGLFGSAMPAVGTKLGQLEKDLAAAQKAVDEDKDAVSLWTGAIGTNKTAVNDHAAAVEAAVQASVQQAQRDADFQRQLAADAQMTSVQQAKRLEWLRQEGPIIEGQQAALEPFIATSKEAKRQYDDLDAKLSAYRGEIEQLTNTFIPATKAAEEAKDATKNFFEELKKDAKAVADDIKKVGDAIANFHKAQTQLESDLATQSATAKEREANAERQYTQGSLEDTEARRQIALKESRDETKLKQDTANAIADIDSKLYEKQTQDIINFSRQMQDDQTKYQQSVAKYERDAQAQAEGDKENHLARLAEIGRKDTASEAEALLNRNFKKLYTDDLHRQESVQKENIAYAQREEQLQDHLKRQENELAISTQNEMKHQELALQRKLEDQQRAAAAEIVQKTIDETRKLQVIDHAEQQQLADLTAMEGYKIKLLHEHLADELKLYEQQEKAKLALLAHTRDEIIKESVRNAINSAGGVGSIVSAVKGGLDILHGLKIFDSGGSFNAGEPFMKGPISEDFTFGGGKGYNLGGSALVYPLQGGSATPVSGGGGKNITFSPTLNIAVPAGQQVDGRQIMSDMLSEFQSYVGGNLYD